MGLQTHTTFDDAFKVLKTLNDSGFQAMFAGGCVRDRVLGLTSKDFDIATTSRPSETQDLFRRLDYRVIPTGFDHGTVTVVTASGPVEVTTLRKDVKTDGRHAVVEFDGATFATDAARRDFTINAMFEDTLGSVHDYFDGLADLNAKILRFVGDPAQRIREDYLRILRFFRFWARFGLNADPAALAAIEQNAAGLAHVSQERVTSELWGTFSAPFFCDPLVAAHKSGVLKLILPESIPINHGIMITLRDAENSSPDIRPWIVLSVLLGIIRGPRRSSETLHDITRRLRMSEKDARILNIIFSGWGTLKDMNNEVGTALDFAEHVETNAHHFELLRFFGPIWHFLARHAADNARQERLGWLIAADQAYGERRKMALPVSGRDIMDLHPDLTGSRIGEMMTAVRRAFRNGTWQTRPEGLEYLRQLKLD